MSRATLLALAERVEAATGADRELDAEIACAVKFPDLRPAHPNDFDGKHGYSVGNIKCEHGFLMADRYTASLDAAMSLVPSGCFGAQVSSHTDCTGGATCWDSRGNPYSVNAATPALALTAACLRAIAWSMTDD